jgi:outer membrane protein insertion porin family
MQSLKKILISLAFISFSAHSQIIDKINITGLHTIDRGTVLNYLPFESGDFYSQNLKSKFSSAILNTGFFKDVIISDSGNILTIEVIENPTIKDVIITMESEDLIELDKVNENLNNFGISKGKIYNQTALDKFLTQIKNVYQTGGYAHATVKHQTIIDADNLATINIDIDEHEVIKIATMSVTGNNHFSQEDLLDLFDIGEADNFLFNFFTKRDHFSQIALDAGIDKLINFYLNNGYLDIKINKVSKDTIDANNININIDITEGALYYIGEITFDNTSELTQEQLNDLFALNTGDIFKRSQVVDGIQNITNFLADKGYAFTKVDSQPNKSVINNKHTMNLTIKVADNQKVYINRITIDGNTRTSDEVIRREIGVLEGGLYSNTKIEKSLTKLKRLGFFSDVSMKVSKVQGANDRINLHFTITETKTGQFSIGISHSNATGVSFNTGIKEKNIFGSGNELNASIAYSKAVKNIDLFFLNPYFTADGHSISYGIFNKEVDGSELESSSYITNKTGVSLGYGIPLDEDSRINANIKLSTIDITCGGAFASSGYEPEQCANDYNSEIYTSISYIRNTLNNAIFPTQGDNLNITTGIALPLTDYRYYKVDTSYRKYIPLSNKLTLKVNGRVGIADGYGDRELPFFERYYGGGASSVRGFSFNSLGEEYPDGTSKGGKLSLLGSVSVISPLSWVKDSENMRIAAFIDAGGIDKEVSFKGVSYRASAGVGFVWVTPIGPLGLYAATPIKKENGDDIKNFDFTLGTSF